MRKMRKKGTENPITENQRRNANVDNIGRLTQAQVHSSETLVPYVVSSCTGGSWMIF